MKTLIRPTQSKGKETPSPAGCTTSSKPFQRDPASEHPAQPQPPPLPLASASRSPPGPRHPRGLPGRPPPGGAPGAGPSLRRAGALGRGGRRQCRDPGSSDAEPRRAVRDAAGAVSPGGAPRTRLAGGREGKRDEAGQGRAEPSLPEGLAGPLRSAPLGAGSGGGGRERARSLLPSARPRTALPRPPPGSSRLPPAPSPAAGARLSPSEGRESGEFSP